jgi:predicted SnoaL-like aldol condensation-catalyzing enzyme
MAQKSNKDSAENFLKLIVNDEIDSAYQKYVSSNFRHHNPYFKGDAESLKAAMKDVAKETPNMQIKIHHTLEENDLVAVHSRISQDQSDTGIAFVHIFRFENNLIVELWDIGQEIPKESKNEYGMF